MANILRRFAKDYQIVAITEFDKRYRLKCERKPKRVAALLVTPLMFTNLKCALRHRATVFLEDEMHDWNWHRGVLTYGGIFRKPTEESEERNPEDRLVLIFE